MSSRPTITVAVCTRGRPGLLAGCLERLRATVQPPDQVLVVHNAEHDEATEAVLRGAGQDWVCEPRVGLDFARNRALREATTEIVAFLDDDARPEVGWLDALAAGFAEEQVVCVSGRVLAAELETPAQRLLEECKSFDRGDEPIDFRLGHPTFFFPVRAGVMGTGSNMACRRVAALELGFDEALDVGTPSRGAGDLDFFYRIVRAGGTVAYRPDAVVRHVHRRTEDELRQMRFDYGVASSAFAWKCLVVGRDVKAAAFLAYKVGFHCAEIAANLLGLRRWPARLAWQELRGMLHGPLAYRRARRCLRTT